MRTPLLKCRNSQPPWVDSSYPVCRGEKLLGREDVLGGTVPDCAMSSSQRACQTVPSLVVGGILYIISGLSRYRHLVELSHSAAFTEDISPSTCS